MNSKTADWAAVAGSVDWANVKNAPNSLTMDISALKAAAFSRGQLPIWSGKKFIPVNASTLIDTSGFFSTTNKPYDLYGLTWNPGTLTPFYRASTSFKLDSITAGTPVIVGIPHDLEGVLCTVNVLDGEIDIIYFNSTPYDVTFTEGMFQILVMK